MSLKSDQLELGFSILEKHNGTLIDVPTYFKNKAFQNRETIENVNTIEHLRFNFTLEHLNIYKKTKKDLLIFSFTK